MKKNELRKQNNDWCTLKLSGFKQGLHLSIPRKSSVGFFFLGVLLALLLTAPAQLKAEAETTANSPAVEQFERKNLRGIIGATNKEGMAFILKVDTVKKTEAEMWLPFENNLRLSGYTTTADIQQGDEAVVTYEENKEGTKRVLREVNFVQRNQPVEAPAAEEENEEQPA